MFDNARLIRFSCIIWNIPFDQFDQVNYDQNNNKVNVQVYIFALFVVVNKSVDLKVLGISHKLSL